MSACRAWLRAPASEGGPHEGLRPLREVQWRQATVGARSDRRCLVRCGAFSCRKNEAARCTDQVLICTILYTHGIATTDKKCTKNCTKNAALSASSSTPRGLTGAGTFCRHSPRTPAGRNLTCGASRSSSSNCTPLMRIDRLLKTWADILAALASEISVLHFELPDRLIGTQIAHSSLPSSPLFLQERKRPPMPRSVRRVCLHRA
jgi:hypothetical protein